MYVSLRSLGLLARSIRDEEMQLPSSAVEILKTERELVSLSQGARNVFHLGFKSVCVELTSAHLKKNKAPKCWNDWRKVVFLLVLAISLCHTTSVIERKQLAAQRDVPSVTSRFSGIVLQVCSL